MVQEPRGIMLLEREISLFWRMERYLVIWSSEWMEVKLECLRIGDLRMISSGIGLRRCSTLAKSFWGSGVRSAALPRVWISSQRSFKVWVSSKEMETWVSSVLRMLILFSRKVLTISSGLEQDINKKRQTYLSVSMVIVSKKVHWSPPSTLNPNSSA